MAFTTLALMGLAAAGGAFAAKKLAPGPAPDASSLSTAAATPATPPAAPDTTAAASSAAAGASTAGTQTRRRAMAGSDLVNLGVTSPMQSGIQPRLGAQSLLGR